MRDVATVRREREVELYCAAREVADLVFAELEARGGSTSPGRALWLEDRRGERVNPCHVQARSGLFLEMYYGLPSRLWTPWGVWGFAGSGMGNFSTLVGDLLPKLGAAEFRPQQTMSMGEFGPVYALTSVGGRPLPRAELRERGEFVAYEDAHRRWVEMAAEQLAADIREVNGHPGGQS